MWTFKKPKLAQKIIISKVPNTGVQPKDAPGLSACIVYRVQKQNLHPLP